MIIIIVLTNTCCIAPIVPMTADTLQRDSSGGATAVCSQSGDADADANHDGGYWLRRSAAYRPSRLRILVATMFSIACSVPWWQSLNSSALHTGYNGVLHM